MEKETIQHLQKLASVFKTDNIITPKEIEQVLVGILAIMNSFKKGNETLNATTKQNVSDLLAKIIEQNKSMATSTIETFNAKSDVIVKSIDKKAKIFDTKIKQAKKLIDDLNAIELQDGVDADPEKIIEEVLARMPQQTEKEPIEETGESLVAKINGLPIDNEDFLIDYSRIKNAPQMKTTPNGGGWRNLYQQHDVAISNPQDGDALVYNGTLKAWVNKSASANSGDTYANEIVAGSGTSWTLAHIPADATKVKVYGGGSRLTPGGGADFTITGNSITTTNSYPLGQLLADYS